jgi:lipoprotein
MKNLFKVLLISSLVLTGCSSTKAETPQEKTPYEKGNERVSNILDPGKITVETDGVYKMDMTVSDFNFLSQRQFHDFVFNQRNRGKFKVLKVYLDNGAILTSDNGNVLIYDITLNSTIYKAIYFKYNPESGLYSEEKTNKLLEVNRNAAYPNYFE